MSELLSLQHLFSALLVLPFFFLLAYHHRRYRCRIKTPPPPRPTTPSTQLNLKPLPFLGVLPYYIKNRHRFLDWMTDVLAAGPTLTFVFVSPGQVSGIITADPRNVEYILKTNSPNYPKGPRAAAMMQDFLGGGIFNSDGEPWRAQRKTASLEFSTRSLRDFAAEAVRDEIRDRLVPLLVRAAEAGAVVDLQDVLERFAFDNICRVIFGADPVALAGGGGGWELDGTRSGGGGVPVPPGFMAAFDDAAKLSADRFFDALKVTWRVKRFLNIGSERRLREAVKIVHDFATAVARARLEQQKQGNAGTGDDLLSRFVSNSAMDYDEAWLRDVVVNFILAGRETTSATLSWFFWVLTSRPDVEQKILAEIAAVKAARHSGGAGGTLAFDELRQMHYLHAAITESLRLYPPVPNDSMECAADDVLPDGTAVRAGWFVTYTSFCMGRMEKVWGKDCLEYRPERWLVPAPEGKEGRLVFQPESQFRFPVFHAGPRACLGREMAYTQMKAVAASVIEGFELELVDRERKPGYVLSLTLRMRDGLPIMVRRRRPSVATEN